MSMPCQFEHSRINNSWAIVDWVCRQHYVFPLKTLLDRCVHPQTPCRSEVMIITMIKCANHLQFFPLEQKDWWWPVRLFPGESFETLKQCWYNKDSLGLLWNVLSYKIVKMIYILLRGTFLIPNKLQYFQSNSL